MPTWYIQWHSKRVRLSKHFSQVNRTKSKKDHIKIISKCIKNHKFVNESSLNVERKQANALSHTSL